ncbi:MAG: hypothetical protein HQ557_15950 [Bacteroidetes bacterium]|nr:hypothetical protein [Bacteroidota bacterium]
MQIFSILAPVLLLLVDTASTAVAPMIPFVSIPSILIFGDGERNDSLKLRKRCLAVFKSSCDFLFCRAIFII